MKVGPRVVFTRFTSLASPSLGSWIAHAARVTGHEPELVASTKPHAKSPWAGGAGQAEATPSHLPTVVVWHLVSANNRTLARSAQLFSAIDDAIESAERSIISASRLQIANVRDDPRGVHGWLANDSDSMLMICARWYLSERDRKHSVDLACESLGAAVLRPGTRLIHRVTGADIRESSDTDAAPSFEIEAEFPEKAGETFLVTRRETFEHNAFGGNELADGHIDP